MRSENNNHPAEIQRKLARLRARMAARSIDAVRLSLTANTAWITAGAATFVNEAADGGPSSVLITADRAYVITDSIEGPRLRAEEQLEDRGFEFLSKSWHSSADPAAAIVAGKRMADDTTLRDDLIALRSVLEPEECERFRHVGKLAAEAMDEAIRATQPGDSEFTLAARLSSAGRERGGSPIVNLIASDERIFNFRHPLPTAKAVEKYAMLVLCLRLDGLIASITRLVHFGAIPADLAHRLDVVARVDAALIGGTRAGRTMGDMFTLAAESYKAEGFPSAIDEHHQGGSAGYGAREAFALPGNPTPIVLNQAFAWNPSVSGAKSEDTILLTESGVEVLTAIDGWPTVTVSIGDQRIDRPVVLVI